MNKTLIILPTYNESENINILKKGIYDLKIDCLSILIVDYNSYDKTVENINSSYPTQLA